MGKINTRSTFDPRTLENPFQHLPVLDSLTTPPVSPNDGDRYRIIATATGAWAGQEDRIAVYDILEEAWTFEKLSEGSVVYDLENDNYQHVNNAGVFAEFDKFPVAISDVTGLQSALDAKEPTIGFTPENVANKDAVNGYAGLDASSKLKLAQFPSGNGLEVLRRNAGNTALEFGAPAGGVDPNSVGDAEIIAHTSTKITITAKAQLNSGIVYEDESNISTVAGDFLQPSLDNQGNIGIPTKRYASVRAVLIQSGDIVLSDKKTGKKLYIIDEDKDGITFKTARGKKLMRILRNGDLLVRGKIKEGAKF